MLLLRRLPAVVLLLALPLGTTACGPDEPRSEAPPDPSAGEATPPMRSGLLPDSLASRMVASLAPAAGERILLVGGSGRFTPLADALARRLEDTGARVVGRVASGEEASLPPLDSVDVGVMLPGAREVPVYDAWRRVLDGGRGRALHVHWDGAYDPDMRERVVEPAVDLVYQSAILDVERSAMADRQRTFAEALRGAAVRVETGEGTDLTFRVGERPVVVQDGDASARRMEEARTLVGREVELPAGAVRVAPLEETVEGRVVLPESYWDGEWVQNLRITFSAGTVSQVEADYGVEAVEAWLDSGEPAARRFREFALGFNPVLEVPRRGFPWIAYYGYGAGVVRVALGANAELGGAVEGDASKLLFLPAARVTVDDVRWVDYGRFVER